MADGVDLSRKFVSESELEEKRKKRQEEWEKVRMPDDPEEVPEEEYDPRSLFERLQEQKDKKQEEYEEQFKFKNMVKGLDEDETNFLDEVSRQQSLVEKQRRDEDHQEIQEYRSALKKLAASESQKKEPEKRAGPKPPEHKTSHLSQAHLLAGAVKRRSSSQSSESSKKQKVEETAVAAAAGIGSQTEQETAEQNQVPRAGVARGGMLHLPSAAVCVGILPGLGAYSGSSDSESSSDSEGSVDGTNSPIKRHRLFR
ncbi:PSME3-interacting protein isoform X1 [Astyanax mexicanus]|uniref:PSME3-interacting protein isoform X1 n=1 Tax=Astyanax mexicanus TaxID=7994 RepID=UPI000BBDAEBC|nr:PSME3-interacting protein isoform X1 [Astyanax mexicanus]